jgi:hypothetical protein
MRTTRTVKPNLLLCILTLLLVISLAGCGQKETPGSAAGGTTPPKDLASCKADTDCVPMPACHPMECINQKYASLYKKPDVCTLIFIQEAAYSAKDCVCAEGKCENKNKPKPEQRYTEEESVMIAKQFVENSSTYLFDGFGIAFKDSAIQSCQDCWKVRFTFSSISSGYGDRTGKTLDFIETSHLAALDVEQGRITTALLDGKWDMIKGQLIPAAEEAVPSSEIYCETDTDCACGVHTVTKDCFYGNVAFVDTTKQCPDFCTGIAAMFEIKCVNNECRQVRTS